MMIREVESMLLPDEPFFASFMLPRAKTAYRLHKRIGISVLGRLFVMAGKLLV